VSDDIHFEAPITHDRVLSDVVVRTGFTVESGCLTLRDVLIAPEAGDITVLGGKLELHSVGLSSALHVMGGEVSATQTTFRGEELVVTAGAVRAVSCSFETRSVVAVSVSGSAQVHVEDCLFDLVDRGATAIHVSDEGRLEARECTFELAVAAVDLDTKVAAWIDKCRFNELETAIAVRSAGQRHQLTSNVFGRCGIAVDVHAMASPDILGNEFYGSTRSAIETHNNAAPYLEGNLFEDNREFAIRALGRSKPQIALNAFKRNAGRLHMDARAYPLRYAPVVEWKDKRPFSPSVHSIGNPPALVPRLPQSEPLRMQHYHHLRWVASVVTVVGWLWVAPLALGAGTAVSLGTLALGTLVLGFVIAASLARKQDGRLLVRGWLTRGEVVTARSGFAQVRFVDRNGQEHEHWTWLPRGRKGQTLDVLYDAAKPNKFIPILPGTVRFGRNDPAADNRKLLPAPPDGQAGGELEFELWDGPSTNSTALQKTPNGLVDRIRAKRDRAKMTTRPTRLGQVLLKENVLSLSGVRIDLGQPFTLTATAWPTNERQVEVYVQISGRSPGTADRVTAGLRTLLSQDRVSREVPSQQRVWPWIAPLDFDPLYGHLVHLNRIHGGTPPAISTFSR
jgi:hypothetical protein